MQERDGSMRLLELDEVEINPKLLGSSKVIREGKYFKIKQCYFKIVKINPKGIEAEGVSRREYFDNRKQ